MKMMSLNYFRILCPDPQRHVEASLCLQMHLYNATVLREHIRWVGASCGNRYVILEGECADRIMGVLKGCDDLEKVGKLVDKLRLIAARVTKDASSSSEDRSPGYEHKSECQIGSPPYDECDFVNQWVNGPDTAYVCKHCIETCWLGWSPHVGDEIGGGYIVVRRSTAYGKGLLFRHIAIGKPKAPPNSTLAKCLSGVRGTLGGIKRLTSLMGYGGGNIALLVTRALRKSNVSLISVGILLLVASFRRSAIQLPRHRVLTPVFSLDDARGAPDRVERAGDLGGLPVGVGTVPDQLSSADDVGGEQVTSHNALWGGTNETLHGQGLKRMREDDDAIDQESVWIPLFNMLKRRRI
jgi:hypothetical protein